MNELSKEDQDLLRLGPQFYLPDQVIRYQKLKKMPRNQISATEIKTKVERLKNELYWEEHKYGSEARGLAHKYLNKVLDVLDEYRL